MQVFNAFFKVLKKKLPGSLPYLIIFFIISTFLARGTTEVNTFSEEKLDIVVFDKDETAESKQLVDYISTKHNVVRMEENKEKIMDRLYYGSISYALVIKKGYAENIKKGETDNLFENYHLHDGFSDVLVNQFLNKYVSSIHTLMTVGESYEDAVKKTEKQLDVETQVTVENFDGDKVPEYTEEFSNYYRFMPYILICVLFNSLAPSLLVMRKKKLRNRTLCAPIKSSSYTVQMFLSSMILVAALWIIFTLFSMFLYGGIFRGIAWLAVLNSFVFAVLVTMMALMISYIVKSEQVVPIITQIVSIGMCFTCGVFVQMDLLGEGVLKAARFLPAYWYEKANNMLCGIEPYSFNEYLTCILIEVGFAAVFMIVAIAVGRLSVAKVPKQKKAATT
ncbi:MAG: ABC transporter permease [Eubacterium sp.]|nr:ABC transporter permease [Eubacterium sp.]